MANLYADPSGAQFAVVAPNLTPTLAGMQPFRVGPGIQFQAPAAWVVPEPKPYVAQGIERAVGAVSQGITARYKAKQDAEKDAEAKREREEAKNWKEYTDWERLKMEKEAHDVKMAKERMDAVGSGAIVGDGVAAAEAIAARFKDKKPQAPQTQSEKAADSLAQTPGAGADAQPATVKGSGRDASESAFSSAFSIRTTPQQFKPVTLRDSEIETPAITQTQQLQGLEKFSEDMAEKGKTLPRFELSAAGEPGALEAPQTAALSGLRATFVPTQPALTMGPQEPTMSPGQILFGAPVVSSGPSGMVGSPFDFRQETQAALSGQPVRRSILLGMEPPVAPVRPAPEPQVTPRAPGEPSTAPVSMNQVSGQLPMTIGDMPFAFKDLRQAAAFAEKIESDQRFPYRMVSFGKPDHKGEYRSPEYVRKDAPPKIDPKIGNFLLRQENAARAERHLAETQVHLNSIVQDFAQKGGPSSSIELLLESYAKASDPKQGSKTIFDNDLIQIIARMARGNTPTENEIKTILDHRDLQSKLKSFANGKLTGDILTQDERDKIASLAAEVYNKKAQKANEEVVKYRMRFAKRIKDPVDLPSYFAGGEGIDVKMMLKKEAAQEMKRLASELIKLEKQQASASPQNAAKIASKKQMIQHEAELLRERINESKDEPGVYLHPKRPHDGHFVRLIEEYRKNPPKESPEDLKAEENHLRMFFPAASSSEADNNFNELGMGSQ